MNYKIGYFSSIINCLSVLAFALSMLLNSYQASCIASIFIALSFIPMIAAFTFYADDKVRSAGYTATIYAAIYASLILIVYFTQLTAVSLGGLSAELADLLDYRLFGLFFSLNLLGYGLMALSTFFIGLTIQSKSTEQTWLKWLLLIHGVFFISGFILPITGIFTKDMDGGDWIGTVVLMFWCAYFIPIGFLSSRFFKDIRKTIISLDN